MSLVDVSELMTDPEFTTTISILRAQAPTLSSEGVSTPAFAAPASIVAIVQPATEADLKALPEGVNLTDVICVWSGQEMSVADETGNGSDVLVVGSKSYRVVKREDWVGNGYRCVFAEGFSP